MTIISLISYVSDCFKIKISSFKEKSWISTIISSHNYKKSYLSTWKIFSLRYSNLLSLITMIVNTVCSGNMHSPTFRKAWKKLRIMNLKKAVLLYVGHKLGYMVSTWLPLPCLETYLLLRWDIFIIKALTWKSD